MPEAMLDDIRWVIGVSFVVWTILGLGYGLKKGVKAGFVLYAVSAVVALGVAGPFGLFLLAVVTPFGAIGGLAGAWAGSAARPVALKAMTAIRRGRARDPQFVDTTPASREGR